MAHIVLHNENTEEDFRYEVPTREAQALADLMGGGGRLLRLSWSVQDASDDVLVPRSARSVVPVTPQSGYTPCACRDCMDIAISAEIRGTYTGLALCLPCAEAGCEFWHNGDTGTSYECQREDAYGEC